MNLRGTRESSLLVGFPTYAFVGSLLLVLGIGLVKTSLSGGHPAPVIQPPEFPHETAAVSLWLLVRSFASGCTAMTGVEAVSNGVTAFSQPVVRNAHWTLTLIVGTLLLLLMGIAHLSVAYGVGAIPQSSHHYQSIISQLTGAIVGRGLLYYITIASLLAVLSLSANTSFAGFPRLCRVVAEDDFLPHAFANLGRRLVYSLGITILASLSAVLLIVFGGVTDRLIPLFAVGAFLAFTISQASMVVHWKREPGFRTNFPMAVNALGACATAVALIIIIVAKFREGAWLTVIIIPSLVFLFNRIRIHYVRVARATACRGALDTSPLREPIAVVPIGGWNTVAEKCLRYALNTSRHVEVFFVYADQNEASQLRQNWAKFVEGPLRRADMACPRLITVSSPYRLLYEPVIKHVKQLRLENPETYVNVFVPELVQTRWFEYLLHNQRALGLKALLLFQRDPYIVVTSVPWYLDDAC
jgi:hypothetical protein